MVILVISPGFSLRMPKSYRDLKIRWCHLSTIPGTRPHCLVSTGGDVNFLETRNLVYIRLCAASFSVSLGWSCVWVAKNLGEDPHLLTMIP